MTILLESLTVFQLTALGFALRQKSNPADVTSRHSRLHLRSDRGVFCLPVCGSAMRGFSCLLLGTFLLSGCGRSVPHTTSEIQRAVDAGGTIVFPAGTYELTQTIVFKKSNTVIQGAGPSTVFVFKPSLPQVQCVNDRAFTTSCDVFFTPGRHILGPIAIGDGAFTAADDVSDLRTGDWLIVEEIDRGAGDVVVIDWAQVAFTSGNNVHLQTPFRTAFPNARAWDPHHSGLGFYRSPQVIEGTQFRDFSLVVPDSGQGAAGISVFAGKHTLIDNVKVQDANGQALYSYMAKDLTVQNSYGKCDQTLNEFAATVDLKLFGNTFIAGNDAGVGLDFGTGFFEVSGNEIPSSVDSGLYLLYGIHDGTVTNNSLGFVNSSGTSNSGNAVGIIARGTQRVNIANNDLTGGAGSGSVGLTIGPEYGVDVPIPSFGNTIAPNTFGMQWGVDYDPTNAP